MKEAQRMRSRDYDDGYDKALAEAAASVGIMDRKLRDMEMAFWSVVAASGGTVSVPRSLLQRFDKLSWEVRRDDANDCVVYRVTV